jgi:diguanylate cyclase (GGDEF)-like protein/PAS domain S-box-containing protein
MEGLSNFLSQAVSALRPTDGLVFVFFSLALGLILHKLGKAHRQRERTLLEKFELTNQDLERRVEARTAELLTLNKSLGVQIEERHRVESRLKNLMQALPDLLFELSPEGVFLNFHSPEQSADLVMEPSQLLGRHVSVALPPLVVEQLLKAMEGVRTAGVPQKFEYELTPWSGQATHFEARVSAIECGGFLVVARNMTEQKLWAQRLSDSETQMNRAQGLAHIGSWYYSSREGSLRWSRETFRIFGIADTEDPNYDRFLTTIHPDDRESVDHAWQAAMKGAPYDIEHRVVVGGEVNWVRERADLEFDGNGRFVAGVGTVQDITAIKGVEQALLDTLEELRASAERQHELARVARSEQGRMTALLSAMSIGILFEDRNGNIEYVNPSFIQIWGIADGARLLGRPTVEVLEKSSHRFSRPDHASKYVLQVLDTHEVSERFELDLSDGRILTQLSYPVSDSTGMVLGRLWIYEDITHERQTAQQLLYLAERDPLTGLYNRHRFQEQLDRMIRNVMRSGGRFALLYFDLDEFKYINDNFGHRAGDTVLIRVAGEVATLVRSSDLFARLGGDEFSILSTLSSQEEIGTLPLRIVNAISSIPFRFRGSNVRLTTSVGVAVYPDHGASPEDLIAHADTAMYQAKGMGKNTWTIFDPTRNPAEAMVERLTWNRRIAQALEEDLFELHFQGVYRADDRKLSHLEALIRMRDPAMPNQLVMPGQFIPPAEKSGQIVDIDRWVLAKTVALLAERPAMPPVAINISGRSFDNPNLPQFIRTLLQDHGVDPMRLIVELTETAAVSDIQDAQRFIEALHMTGCTVCLDDFGSGFSTFSYLKYLGVQILKIDGLFIHDLPNNHDNQVFVRAMVEVARGLRKLTVAEYVEDQATLEMVKQLGVDLAQGYCLDRPTASHPAMEQTAT